MSSTNSILAAAGLAAIAAFSQAVAAQDQTVPAAGGDIVSAIDAPSRATARLRLFGQNGITVRFYENSACFGGQARETQVSGGVGDTFSSFFGSVKNSSVGMRETPNTVAIKHRDGPFSKAYFREYAIGAGRPLTVWMRYQGNPGSVFATCGAIGGTFTPEAGKDYEASLDMANGHCLAVIHEVADAADGSAQLRDVSVSPTEACR